MIDCIVLIVFEKGLTFIPSRKFLPVKNIINTRDKLIRNIKLRYHFSNRQIRNVGGTTHKIPGEINTLHNQAAFKKKFIEPKNWTPGDELMSSSILSTISNIKTATANLIKRHLRIPNVDFTKLGSSNDNTNYSIKLKDKSNLKKEELDSINGLKNMKNLMIKPADKGSTTVLIDRQEYIKEAKRQLNNSKYYTRISEPINKYNVQKIKDNLISMLNNKYITKDQFDYLNGPKEFSPRTFYLLPKILKKKSQWPSPSMPEGRPIVSDVNSESYRVSELIDYYINPLSLKHRSYIKNSFELVN